MIHRIDSTSPDPAADGPPGRLLTAVPSEQLALSADELGADAIDLVSEQPIEAYLDVQATEATDTTEEIEVVEADPAQPPARPRQEEARVGAQLGRDHVWRSRSRQRCRRG